MKKDLRSLGKAEGLAIISVGRSPTCGMNDMTFFFSFFTSFIRRVLPAAIDGKAFGLISQFLSLNS
jgi:hypothetical protein